MWHWLRSAAKKNLERSRLAEPEALRATRVTDPLEKLVLSSGPGETVEIELDGAAAARGVRSTKHVERSSRDVTELWAVRRLLRDRPELAEAPSRRCVETWTAVDGDRGAYLRAMARTRRRLIGLAELHRVSVEAPAATDRLDDGLSSYLVEIEGRGHPSRASYLPRKNA
jgi:hypothetical protein